MFKFVDQENGEDIVFSLPEWETDFLLGEDTEYDEGFALEWGKSPVLVEALELGGSGKVREEFLITDPEEVSNLTDPERLQQLLELYRPVEAENEVEEKFLTLLRNCVLKQLETLDEE